ncbi:MAG: type II toxin-antitoxin system HicA family toxin [Candidatus Eremiobacteraeota bacterium]|nr:type II toxin-antitoxin system HicA family toxin [Candidatus Eremiobacteraeota bacterium]
MPKTRALIQILERDGWTLDRITGSHHVFVHPTKPGIVVVPVHGMNREVATGTQASILKQAGLKL